MKDNQELRGGLAQPRRGEKPGRDKGIECGERKGFKIERSLLMKSRGTTSWACYGSPRPCWMLKVVAVVDAGARADDSGGGSMAEIISAKR